jgi:cytochrome b561
MAVVRRKTLPRHGFGGKARAARGTKGNEMNQMRHHPLRVTFHWLLAALVILMLGIGFLWLRPMPNTDSGKISVLGLHMACGVLILLLSLARLGLRLAPDALPRPRRSAAFVHNSLYVLIALLLATGIATALIAGLPRLVLGGAGAHLPARFTIYPTFIVHALLAELLAVLTTIHIVAALYHQFVLRDGLLSRMAYGSSPQHTD